MLHIMFFKSEISIYLTKVVNPGTTLVKCTLKSNVRLSGSWGSNSEMFELYRVRLKWYKLKVMEPEISENFEKMSSFFSLFDQFWSFLIPIFLFCST